MNDHTKVVLIPSHQDGQGLILGDIDPKYAGAGWISYRGKKSHLAVKAHADGSFYAQTISVDGVDDLKVFAGVEA